MAEEATQPARAASPQDWASPTLPAGQVPGLDNSSTSSSSVSGMSAGSRRSWGGLPNGRRGYMRPEGTSFADSAKNRESVMSLGTIAHLQYYFARTGLLDDKGGRVAKETKRKKSSNAIEGLHTTADRAYESFLSSQDDNKRSSCAISDDGYLSESATDVPFVESPVGEDFETHYEYEPAPMLPPTVSTYKNKVLYTPPPPDIIVLRRELREALEDAKRVLAGTERPDTIARYKRKAAETEKIAAEAAEKRKQDDASGNISPEAEQEPLPVPQGWTEIQGLHVLDSVTLAIRAAKNYYTAHEQPERLYSIKPEKTIRKELYQTLEVLKRMAGRDFEGGIRDDERQSINGWINDIGQLLDSEQAKEEQEQLDREKWSWISGDWTGKEREREWLFLKSFDPHPEDEIPSWTAPEDASELPTPFLKAMHDGLKLVRLHNSLVRKSKRQFEEIKSYHRDTSLPYRCAENLRYWVKAAELRWEVKLKLDVMEVVHGESSEAWKSFDRALMKWCKGVREEITTEWKQARLKTMTIPPMLKIDTETMA
ncbi:hypothetical protein BFW01_g5373 [Lasiodiplodia theobromae]|uniref:Uncharacterized protein n=1 Tax=Lasiodiplodia theobromae TaxID=45133 RepID=A0A5N5D8W1_9PEZI|nr:uncharacterized protein LTHEOB_12109 [Lasiodiplodia theobromae]KAB2574077.1 hypothetical protein DBV05_g7225 [Lasiodiplodia theobromae]KAF4536669.1 hypothetical protein LTHEOB_12109 [Lasiodiplodia theobromae]KAF9634478.1 hypothetical protein BFW01_g5373 [Lasiodiplodia theobromae]